MNDLYCIRGNPIRPSVQVCTAAAGKDVMEGMARDGFSLSLGEEKAIA